MTLSGGRWRVFRSEALTHRRTRELVGNKLLPANVRQDIIERTDGIPLFVEEMTKAVLEAGSEGTAQHTAAAIPSPTLAVPASLQASLMARLDRLASARETAQIGAVLGRRFSHELIAAVAAVSAAATGGFADTARARRALAPARHTARRGIHLQARPCAKRRLQHIAAQPPPTNPCPNCDHLGDTIPRDRRRPTSTHGPALHRRRAQRKGSELPAKSGPAGDRALRQRTILLRTRRSRSRVPQQPKRPSSSR